jgi:predicted AlkP superfamily pyrophosphatase or phosphodiesterase
MNIRCRGQQFASGALVLLSVGLMALTPTGRVTGQQSRGEARLILVVVVDGLRPDSINAEDTPTLYRLRREGTSYLNAHAVFPTVTRVNAAAISTGTYPQVNGLVSNSMFVPGVHPTQAFNTGDYRQLLKLQEVSGGRLLFARSLGEHLHEKGIRFAAVSSGSTGNALLLNHRAPQGVGVLVNGAFDPGRRVAYPDDVNAAIISRFGAAPREEGSALVDWTDRVLREYILPELRPEVVLDWQTEPDGAQHANGVGSELARQALRNSDRNLGITLAKLGDLGLADKTDVIVTSDHGFSLHNYGVGVTQELIKAGLKGGAESDDIVVASNGQSVLLHVKARNPERIKQIVRYLQAQDWVDVIFTTARQAASRAGRGSAHATGNEQGWVEGTFSLELIHEENAERGPDILFTLPWSSAPNTFGVPGTHYTTVSGATGPLTGVGSGHGGISPWLVRNTLIMWGVDFKRGATVRTPSCNVDIAPTILALKGITGGDQMQGRVLHEALSKGPDQEQVSSETRIVRTQAGSSYRAAVQVSEVGKHRYIDKGWRIR